MAAEYLSICWRKNKILRQLTKINELNTTIMLNRSSITGSHITSVNNGNGTTSRLASTKVSVSATLGHATDFISPTPSPFFENKFNRVSALTGRITLLPFTTVKYQLENLQFLNNAWRTTERNHRHWTSQLKHLRRKERYAIQFYNKISMSGAICHERKTKWSCHTKDDAWSEETHWKSWISILHRIFAVSRCGQNWH